MILNFFIGLYLLGYLVFTLLADFGMDADKLNREQVIWNMIFRLWQQFGYGSVLAWGTLFFKLKSFDRLKVRWVFIFSICLSVWQVISLFTGWQINDRWASMAGFCMIIGIIGYLVLREESKAQKWLNRNAP